MKLANRAYVITLLMFLLVLGATAQKRPESDPRNTAPTVGTGGSVGGPTGLFTVYDGQTLRKGEYTFGAAVSNYDRDPGNADITSVPVSFQIGVTNYLEFFFSTDMYRGIKVNSPRNLSGFYLPNSRVLINGVYTSAPAIILAPRGSGTPQVTGAVFRPTGNQPFIQFPFFGGSAGTFGLNAPFFSGNVFGFANNGNALLGGGAAVGNGAANFPGIGSVYGSILPGLVLQTAPNQNANGAPVGEIPTIFTLAPSYLPDAPFINRTYGESAFNSFNTGVKWRFTNNANPVGIGLVASYTWYADKASNLSGFNQMQRGSGPGAGSGDINVTLFGDARLAKWMNLSSNVGYTYTSKVKGTFTSGSFTMLDRGDELTASIGVDFPVNKYFQPIFEFRSLRYVGGRTPNAFENNPIEGIAGARVFFTRWAGVGFAYRHHFNQQDLDSFENSTFSTTVLIPRTGTTGNTVATTTVFTGKPQGFAESFDPHGYIFNVWIGRRDKRATEVVNQSPSISGVSLSDTVITLGCRPGYRSVSGSCDDSRTVSVSTSASDPEGDPLVYNYTVSGGRIVGSGANVSWDLSGVAPGTYTITTGVDDGCGVCGKTDTRTVKVEECNDCKKICDCPSLSVSGPSGMTAPGSSMNFTANVSGGANVTYNWTVSAGTISSGQGTSSITVDTTKAMAGQTVTATVEIGGLDANCNCPSTDSASGPVSTRPEASLIDEFGPQKDDEVKARVDNFYIQLNNNPTAQGVIINYGTAAQIKARKAQIMKAINFRKYDPTRVTFVDGGNPGNGINTKFWLVPAGADNPNP